MQLEQIKINWYEDGLLNKLKLTSRLEPNTILNSWDIKAYPIKYEEFQDNFYPNLDNFNVFILSNDIDMFNNRYGEIQKTHITNLSTSDIDVNCDYKYIYKLNVTDKHEVISVFDLLNHFDIDGLLLTTLKIDENE